MPHNFLSSLEPCTSTMVACSKQKICAAALPNSTFQAAFSIKEKNYLVAVASALDFSATALSAFARAAESFMSFKVTKF